MVKSGAVGEKLLATKMEMKMNAKGDDEDEDGVTKTRKTQW